MTIDLATEILLEIFKVKAVKHSEDRNMLIIICLDDQMTQITVDEIHALNSPVEIYDNFESHGILPPYKYKS